MNTKSFSILMCSRSRPSILETNVVNILTLADHPEEVEILIGADDDDEATLHKIEELKQLYPQVKPTVLPRFKNLHKFYNALAAKAQGKYVWGMNDDSLVEYNLWDSDFADQIEKQIASHKDRIGYFAISSNSSDKLGDYGEFPIVTKEALNALGFMDFEPTETWSCDMVLQRIYQSVGRAFYLKVDRPMRHLLHEVGSAPNENREYMVARFHEQYGPDWNEAVKKMYEHATTIDISVYTERLRKKIHGGDYLCEY